MRMGLNFSSLLIGWSWFLLSLLNNTSEFVKNALTWMLTSIIHITFEIPHWNVSIIIAFAHKMDFLQCQLNFVDIRNLLVISSLIYIKGHLELKAMCILIRNYWWWDIMRLTASVLLALVALASADQVHCQLWLKIQ